MDRLVTAMVEKLEAVTTGPLATRVEPLAMWLPQQHSKGMRVQTYPTQHDYPRPPWKLLEAPSWE